MTMNLATVVKHCEIQSIDRHRSTPNQTKVDIIKDLFRAAKMFMVKCIKKNEYKYYIDCILHYFLF